MVSLCVDSRRTRGVVVPGSSHRVPTRNAGTWGVGLSGLPVALTGKTRVDVPSSTVMVCAAVSTWTVQLVPVGTVSAESTHALRSLTWATSWLGSAPRVASMTRSHLPRRSITGSVVGTSSVSAGTTPTAAPAGATRAGVSRVTRAVCQRPSVGSSLARCVRPSVPGRPATTCSGSTTGSAARSATGGGGTAGAAAFAAATGAATTTGGAGAAAGGGAAHAPASTRVVVATRAAIVVRAMRPPPSSDAMVRPCGAPGRTDRLSDSGSHHVVGCLTVLRPRSKFPTNKVKISSAKPRLAGWQPSAWWGAPGEDLVTAVHRRRRQHASPGDRRDEGTDHGRDRGHHPIDADAFLSGPLSPLTG